jgi:hypothetical protein
MITMVGCVSGRMSSEFLERYNPTLLKMKNINSEGEGNNIDEY